MKYIDRKGNITVDDSRQDQFLRHLYEDWGGRRLLPFLTHRFLSSVAGHFLNSAFSVGLIPPFVEKHHIDMEPYEWKKYTSYNDFFTRRLKPGQRPIHPGRQILISPCDGRLSVYRIGKESRFYIKNTPYTVGELLRNEELAGHYQDGYAMIFRLTVEDYHRYCYPCEGVKSANVALKGIYHTVNPIANDHYPIYRENSREYTLLQTPHFGTLVQMEVGAMMVGKITNYHKRPRKVDKGQEKGRFEFGGSTVVLLVQHGKIRVDEDLIRNTENDYETIVKMGERIGESKLSKRTGKNIRRTSEE